MNMHPIDEPDQTMIDAGDQTTAVLRQITAEQLLHLGTRQVVYLKSGMRDGEPGLRGLRRRRDPPCGGR